MKLQSYINISVRQRVSKYLFILYAVMVSGLIANLNLSIEFDGNYYNASDYVSEESRIYYDDSGTTHHVFDGLLPASDEYWSQEFYLDVKVNGDFNSEYEYADIYIESNLIGAVGNFYDQYSCNFYESYNIDADQFNDYIADDASLVVTIDNSEYVDLDSGCSDYHRVYISYEPDVSFDFGEVEIGSTVSLNLIIDNFYDEYDWHEDDNEATMIFVDIEGNPDFYCTDEESCGTHFINNSSHSVNVSFSPITQSYLEGTIFVYDYGWSNLHEIKLSGTGVLLELLGDMNGDGGLNVYDIVILINYIFDGQYSAIGDLNTDGILNISDIISLINIILDS